MTHPLVNWLDQLVGPEGILKISQVNQIQGEDWGWLCEHLSLIHI